jgi:hypothetical protein
MWLPPALGSAIACATCTKVVKYRYREVGQQSEPAERFRGAVHPGSRLLTRVS